MKKLSALWSGAALAAAATLWMSAAYAQDKPVPPVLSFDELVKLVDGSLPPVLSDPANVVEHLLRAKIETEQPLSKQFNLNTVVRDVFGRGSPSRDAQCAQPLTSTGDRDEGQCTLTSGDPNGDGVFQALTFSKNMQLGNITIFKRPKRADIDPKAPGTDISDAAAYDKARTYAILTLGVPASELPDLRVVAPKAPLPVATLVLGSNPGEATTAAGGNTIPLAKLVQFQRRALLASPLVDGDTKQSLSYAFVPGIASFLVDNAGVQGARVEDWMSLPIATQLDKNLVKNREELVNEIAQELVAQGGHRPAKLQMAFGLGPASNPNPDDINSPMCAKCGAVLVPILRVVEFTFDGTDSPANFVAAPGLVLDFELVGGAQRSPSRLLQ